jgi:hypothetical protein
MLWLFESNADFETLPSKLTQWQMRLLDHHRNSTSRMLPPCSTAAVMP